MKRLLATVPETAAGATDEEDAVAYDFSGRIIQWQHNAGRHALPWQKTTDPYRIWLSEIMLQQTQVTTVIAYYQAFLAAFPAVGDLAAAPQEQVMSLWAGLGYYTRARNLHKAAQQVMQLHDGVFPVDAAVLVGLPGIGRSTAAAIAAFSTGARAAILDGNVKRVLTRAFGIDGFPGEKRVEQRLWRLAEKLLPATGMESYTQGLMDLGATLCTRSRPLCDVCPVNDHCIALATDRVAELPVRKVGKVIPTRTVTMLVCENAGRFWLEQRPSNGIWGGLMSLPERDSSSSVAELVQETGAALPPAAAIADMVVLPAFTHVFTHYRLIITPLLISVSGSLSGSAPQMTFLSGAPSGRWIDSAGIEGAPLPAPVSKLLTQLSMQPMLAL